MAFLLSSRNRTLIVRLDGELDLVSANDFRESVDNALEEMLSHNLLIDLSNVTFIDSSGLGVILGRFRKLKSLGGQIVLFGLNPNVKRILQLSGILSFIPVARTETEAWKIIDKKALKEA